MEASDPQPGVEVPQRSSLAQTDLWSLVEQGSRQCGRQQRARVRHRWRRVSQQISVSLADDRVGDPTTAPALTSGRAPHPCRQPREGVAIKVIAGPGGQTTRPQKLINSYGGGEVSPSLHSAFPAHLGDVPAGHSGSNRSASGAARRPSARRSTTQSRSSSTSTQPWSAARSRTCSSPGSPRRRSKSCSPGRARTSCSPGTPTSTDPEALHGELVHSLEQLHPLNLQCCDRTTMYRVASVSRTRRPGCRRGRRATRLG